MFVGFVYGVIGERGVASGLLGGWGFVVVVVVGGRGTTLGKVLPVYLSSPRTLPSGPHPTHISLPPSCPYPLPPLPTSNNFISSRS